MIKLTINENKIYLVKQLQNKMSVNDIILYPFH